MEPLEEGGVGAYNVELGRRLEKFDLRQDLKLLALLVKVDLTVVVHVRDGRVDHGQVGEERAQVGNRALHRRL